MKCTVPSDTSELITMSEITEPTKVDEDSSGQPETSDVGSSNE